NFFTRAEGACTPRDRITGSVVLADPLGANLNDAVEKPISFSFSDGVKTETNLDTNDSSFMFSTDAAGNITKWEVVVYNAIGLGSPAIQSFNGLIGVYDQGFYDYGANTTQLGQNHNSPGVWTVSAVPEPASWVLMIAGFGGLGAALRRRREALAVA